MDFFKTVNKRGSYRSKFKDIAIPDEDIRKILGAALKAPSGYNLQSTSFVVVTDEKLRKTDCRAYAVRGDRNSAGYNRGGIRENRGRRLLF